jgi:hypothetical protein
MQHNASTRASSNVDYNIHSDYETRLFDMKRSELRPKDVVINHICHVSETSAIEWRCNTFKGKKRRRRRRHSRKLEHFRKEKYIIRIQGGESARSLRYLYPGRLGVITVS